MIQLSDQTLHARLAQAAQAFQGQCAAGIYFAAVTTTQRRAYRDYTADGKYWTVRKYGATYWVVLIDSSSGSYVWDYVWGGYATAGGAGGAAAQLAYNQGQADARRKLAESPHMALDDVGLGLPTPPPAPVPASSAPEPTVVSEDE
ncbi:hypothetical protein [Blastococcus sp. SYSU DS1024]